MSRTVWDVVDALRPDHEAEVEPTRFLLETSRRGRLRRARRRLLAASASALVAVVVLVGLSAAFATRGHAREAPAHPTTSAVTSPAPAPSVPGT
jgi:hypothetical protein